MFSKKSKIPGKKSTASIRQLKNTVYGSMFFECKKAENMQKVSKNLHVFSLLIIWGKTKAPISLSTSLHNISERDYP
jgi:hypothetical protein